MRDVKGDDWEPVIRAPEAADQARRLAEWHDQWAAAQLDTGTVPFRPQGRPEGSDYNQHYIDLEAGPAELDTFFEEARRITGLNPVTGNSADCGTSSD